MKVDESNYEILQKVSELTKTDYEISWDDAENIKGHINTDSLVVMLEDLYREYEVLKEEINDLKHDIKENYELKPFDPWDEYGISPNDFH